MSKQINLRVLLLLLSSALITACGTPELTTVQYNAVDCDASIKRCVVEVEGKRVALTLQPGLVALKPFSISAELEGDVTVESLIIDFQMIGMDMGINRYRLSRKDGIWTGAATLPICSASRTDWLAILNFVNNGKNYQVGFPFSIQ